jgi:hypothetical protein
MTMVQTMMRIVHNEKEPEGVTQLQKIMAHMDNWYLQASHKLPKALRTKDRTKMDAECQLRSCELRYATPKNCRKPPYGPFELDYGLHGALHRREISNALSPTQPCNLISGSLWETETLRSSLPACSGFSSSATLIAIDRTCTYVPVDKYQSRTRRESRIS